MIAATALRAAERWLRQLTVIPTAAGREQRVIRWVLDWVGARSDLRARRDRAGNVIITRSGRRAGRPIFFTAHLDHPAFVTRRVIDDRTVELEFRGGVMDAYFDAAAIEIFDGDDTAHAATITDLEPKAKPFKRAIARLARSTGAAIAAGDVGRWRFRGEIPRIRKGVLYTHACDDLAAVAAALAALDALRRKRSGPNVGVLLTRAEEVGFIGAIAASEAGSVPKTSRLICLENSRSFADSPIGGGPILRVGDKAGVFDPGLTNRLDAIMREHEAQTPGFRWQHKLMPGGTCETTAFGAYGYESTCVCLPLGNYHNMSDIDGTLAGKRPARVGPEHIAIADYRGLVEMLVICAMRLDGGKRATPRARMEKLLSDYAFVLDA